MTASRIPTHRRTFTTPVIDYEPTPTRADPPGLCLPPSPAALHRPSPRPLRAVPVAPTSPPPRDPAPPRKAAVFADAALRHVLEVSDRRRPVAQLRPLLAPALFDAVLTMIRGMAAGESAVLRRVRLRTATVVDGEVRAAEVFATYARGARVRAIAGRIEMVDGRWRVVALQVG